MTDLLTRLRAADPEAHADLTPPEDLLQRLLADLPPAAPKRRLAPRRRQLALAGVGIAGAVLAAASLTGHGTAAGPDLAAQAFAKTDDTTGILHVRTHVESDFTARGNTERTTSTSESWLRGDRGRTHASLDGGAWSDMVLRPDGTVHFHNSDGQDDVTGDADGPDAQARHQQLSTGFVEQFRRDYQRGTLDPGGTTTFDGRRAQRYVVDTHGTEETGRGTITYVARDEYFVAADDGTPLGSISSSSSTTGGETDTLRTTETVDAIEQLPVTPANLDLLGE